MTTLPPNLQARGSIVEGIALINGTPTPVPLQVDINGKLLVNDSASTSVVTAFTGSTVNSVLLAANPNRLGLLIANSPFSSGSILVKLGVGAASGSFSAIVAAGATFEPDVNYTGEVDVVWTSATAGAACVTELSE